jgi:hypothetical protein
MLLALVFVAGLFAAHNAFADNKQDKKESRWQGYIVRVNRGTSSLDVRGGLKNSDSIERKIVYDSSTQWTKQGKPAQQDEFKDGSFVIVLGSEDSAGVFHASRVDLRQPR